MLWAVTTQGDLPDEHESRDHPESVPAWDDYWGRILELEVHGYSQEWEGAAEYGKRWVCELAAAPNGSASRSNAPLTACVREWWRKPSECLTGRVLEPKFGVASAGAGRGFVGIFQLLRGWFSWRLDR